MLSALAENSDFFKDRVNLFLFVGPASRVDRAFVKNMVALCKANEANPSIV